MKTELSVLFLGRFKGEGQSDLDLVFPFSRSGLVSAKVPARAVLEPDQIVFVGRPIRLTHVRRRLVVLAVVTNIALVPDVIEKARTPRYRSRSDFRSVLSISDPVRSEWVAVLKSSVPDVGDPRDADLSFDAAINAENGVADANGAANDLQCFAQSRSVALQSEIGDCSRLSVRSGGSLTDPIGVGICLKRMVNADTAGTFTAAEVNAVSTDVNVGCTASALGSPRSADEVAGADSTVADVDVVFGSVKSEMDVRSIRSGSVWRSHGWAFGRLEVVMARRGLKKATSGGPTEPTMTAGKAGPVAIGSETPDLFLSVPLSLCLGMVNDFGYGHNVVAGLPRMGSKHALFVEAGFDGLAVICKRQLTTPWVVRLHIMCRLNIFSPAVVKCCSLGSEEHNYCLVWGCRPAG